MADIAYITTDAAYLLYEIMNEFDSAISKHQWPSDMVHAAAIVAEESGELVQAVNNHVHHGLDSHPCRREALHTIATCLRFIDALDRDTYVVGGGDE